MDLVFWIFLIWATDTEISVKTVFGDQLNGLGTSWLGGESLPRSKIKKNGLSFLNFLIWATVTEISVEIRKCGRGGEVGKMSTASWLFYVDSFLEDEQCHLLFCHHCYHHFCNLFIRYNKQTCGKKTRPSEKGIKLDTQQCLKSMYYTCYQHWFVFISPLWSSPWWLAE